MGGEGAGMRIEQHGQVVAGDVRHRDGERREAGPSPGRVQAKLRDLRRRRVVVGIVLGAAEQRDRHGQRRGVRRVVRLEVGLIDAQVRAQPVRPGVREPAAAVADPREDQVGLAVGIERDEVGSRHLKVGAEEGADFMGDRDQPFGVVPVLPVRGGRAVDGRGRVEDRQQFHVGALGDQLPAHLERHVRAERVAREEYGPAPTSGQMRSI